MTPIPSDSTRRKRWSTWSSFINPKQKNFQDTKDILCHFYSSTFLCHFVFDIVFNMDDIITFSFISIKKQFIDHLINYLDYQGFSSINSHIEKFNSSSLLIVIVNENEQDLFSEISFLQHHKENESFLVESNRIDCKRINHMTITFFSELDREISGRFLHHHS